MCLIFLTESKQILEVCQMIYGIKQDILNDTTFPSGNRVELVTASLRPCYKLLSATVTKSTCPTNPNHEKNASE